MCYVNVMTSIASDRSLYVPITGRRRAATVAFVALLYAVAALVLLSLRDQAPIRVVPPTRTLVELLPMPKPPEPVVPPKAKPDPANDAVGQQRFKPARVNVDAPPRLAIPSPQSAPLSAAVAPLPLPSAPDLTPLAGAPPAAIAATGGGDRVDNGAGGTGEGGTGTGGNNGGGGGAARHDRPTNLDSLASPVWERDYIDIGEVYPRPAKEARIAGRVQLVCQLTLGHKLVNCSVIRESPAGWQFGKAALEYSRRLRAFPVQRNGRGVDLAWVRFNIDFAPPRR